MRNGKKQERINEKETQYSTQTIQNTNLLIILTLKSFRPKGS